MLVNAPALEREQMKEEDKATVLRALAPIHGILDDTAQKYELNTKDSNTVPPPEAVYEIVSQVATYMAAMSIVFNISEEEWERCVKEYGDSAERYKTEIPSGT